MKDLEDTIEGVECVEPSRHGSERACASGAGGKKMNDYWLMCEDSPIQNERSEKSLDVGDKYVSDFSPRVMVVNDWKIYGNNVVWLPTQEQWQDIWIEQEGGTVNRGLESLFELYKRFDRLEFPINPMQTKESELWTLVWCLFVHKEVYGLVWSWDKKKWVEE